MSVKVTFQDWGRIRYQAAWDGQTRLHEQLKALKKRQRTENNPGLPQDHYLVFCEHPHVYTLGKSGSMDNLLLSGAELEARSIDFLPINRGGDITYHGPGQIVGYPILDLEYFYRDVHRYVREVEEVVMRTLADYGVEAMRVAGYSGVWLDADGERPQRKICAVGIHLSRWVSMHGFAFNVNTDLDFFNNIIPCGIADNDKSVTSLASELNRSEVDMQAVKERVKHHFSEVFNMGFE